MTIQQAEALFASGSEHQRRGKLNEALADLKRAIEIAAPIVEECMKRQLDLMSAQKANAALKVLAESKPARQLLAAARDAHLQAHRDLHGGPPAEPANEKQIASFRAKLQRAFKKLGKAQILGIANVKEAPSSAGYEASQIAKKQGSKGYVYWHEQDELRLKDGWELYLSYGSIDPALGTLAVGRAVAGALKAEKLAVEWFDDDGMSVVTWMPH